MGLYGPFWGQIGDFCQSKAPKFPENQTFINVPENNLYAKIGHAMLPEARIRHPKTS